MLPEIGAVMLGIGQVELGGVQRRLGDLHIRGSDIEGGLGIVQNGLRDRVAGEQIAIARKRPFGRCPRRLGARHLRARRRDRAPRSCIRLDLEQRVPGLDLLPVLEGNGIAEIR